MTIQTKTVVLAIVLCAIGCQREQSKMNDLDAIQGTWRLVAGERHGQPFSDDLLKTVTLTFSDGKLITKTKDRSNENRFTLDPTQNPKHIDMDMDGTLGEGIYELAGDSLKILHDEVGEPRPKVFDPKASPQLTLMILTREKP
jgi:uncharacterized protein (TIGR03067 family)